VDEVADFFSNLTMLADTGLIFSCFAEGKPELTVQIFKDGRQFSPLYTGNHTFVRLPNPRALDSGVYRCEANNSYRLDVREITVLVVEPPNIMKSPGSKKAKPIGDKIYQNVGDTFIIMCNATGHPTPKVTWEYNGRTVQQGSISGVELQDNKHVLVIHNAAVRHTGNYSCTASNMAGTVSRTSLVDVRVSTCSPDVTALKDSKPKCLYTIFVVEESKALEPFRQELHNLSSELDMSLLQDNIGIKRMNYYSVVGFGTKHNARIIRVQSEALFEQDGVADAVAQLNSVSTVPDGYQAIDFALKKLPLKSRKARRCPIHLVLVTSETRSRTVSISSRKIRKRLCDKKPIIFNAIVNVNLAVRLGSITYKGIGIDWQGFPYIKREMPDGQMYQRQEVVNKTIISPIRRTSCSSFKHYGDMALHTNGAMWDISWSMRSQDRSILFGALIDSTLSSLQLEAFQQCVDCRCKRAKNGDEFQRCYTVKDNELCQCRMNGDSLSKCKKREKGLCKTRSKTNVLNFKESLARGC
jgi:hypothetical protein